MVRSAVQGSLPHLGRVSPLIASSGAARQAKCDVVPAELGAQRNGHPPLGFGDRMVVGTDGDDVNRDGGTEHDDSL